MAKRFLTVLIVVVIAASVAGVLGFRYVATKLHEKDLASRLLARPDISITVIEGKRREEIAMLLDAAGVTSKTAFLQASQTHEGYLFPDTYRFFKDTPAKDVVQTMLTDFNNRTKDYSISKEQLILASIVEREASNDLERATIAGVYANRLAISMKLEADPTVQYAKDSESNTSTYWGPITRADYLSVLSPYNTSRIPGLPPGPIANPGIKSIRAAINPAKHDYLYFFHRNGKIVLSKTLQEHEAAIQAADKQG